MIVTADTKRLHLQKLHSHQKRGSNNLMEAPVLPPAPDAAPALVAGSNDQTAPSLPAHLTPDASDSKSLGWLPSFPLTHAFSFLSQAFSSAKSSSLLNFSLKGEQYSAAAPLQWSLSDRWQSLLTSADTEADIQVIPVQASDPIAQAENKVWADLYAEQCLPQAQRELKEVPAYRITLLGKTLGYVADEAHAQLLAQHLRRLLRQAAFDAETVAPQMIPSDSAADEPLNNELKGAELKVAANGYPLFSIDESMAEAIGYSKEWAAVAWANNLRVALEAEPLSIGAAHSGLKNLAASDIALQGEASWYGPYFHGRATANGEIYNQHDLTVAHKSLPFGTYLQVRNLRNDKTVVVRVNDRGPYVGDRSLDLSNAAAQCLGSDKVGVIPYEAVILNEIKPRP
jgi:rare lipoprotein A (peptidoglycan hydrolase)